MVSVMSRDDSGASSDSTLPTPSPGGSPSLCGCYSGKKG